jgi:PadR family transcriptional regulator, regulatory protein AphA
VAQWAEWATEQVEQWPDDPAQAVPDQAAFEQIVRRAQW